MPLSRECSRPHLVRAGGLNAGACGPGTAVPTAAAPDQLGVAQDPVDRRDRAQVGALVEQRLVHLRWGEVGEPSEHGTAAIVATAALTAPSHWGAAAVWRRPITPENDLVLPSAQVARARAVPHDLARLSRSVPIRMSGERTKLRDAKRS